MSRKELEDMRVLRALPVDLERVLAASPRTNDRTKGWMREYFVEGRSCNEIARAHGVAPQHVGSKVRTVRAKLSAQASPLQYVQFTMSLPLLLGKELQGLAQALGARQSFELAENTLLPVVKAVTAARKKLAETHR